MKNTFKNKIVQNLMVTDVKTMAPTDSIFDAVKLMKETGIGCVIVIKENRIVGIFSERDLLIRVVSEGLNSSVEISQVMTKKVITISQESTLENALLLSSTRNIRHIPVVDENKNLQGILSVKDLLGELLEEILPLK